LGGQSAEARNVVGGVGVRLLKEFIALGLILLGLVCRHEFRHALIELVDEVFQLLIAIVGPFGSEAEGGSGSLRRTTGRT
jgi:hypothetical protein